MQDVSDTPAVSLKNIQLVLDFEKMVYEQSDNSIIIDSLDEKSKVPVVVLKLEGDTSNHILIFGIKDYIGKVVTAHFNHRLKVDWKN